jgi:hypothetical protein
MGRSSARGMADHQDQACRRRQTTREDSNAQETPRLITARERPTVWNYSTIQPEGMMNKRRLLKLADLLEADAKNKTGIKFDMGGWGVVERPEAQLSCGTQACAMGLAAISGAFKRAGLEANIYHTVINFRWKGNAVRGYEAAEKLFEISEREADELFSPTGILDEGAAGERAKAKQIRGFVQTGVIPPIRRAR